VAVADEQSPAGLQQPGHDSPALGSQHSAPTPV
jgi:hypothetical protein